MQGDITVATQIRDIAMPLLVAEINVIGECPPIILIEGNTCVGRLATGGEFACQRFNTIGCFQVKTVLRLLNVSTTVKTVVTADTGALRIPAPAAAHAGAGFIQPALRQAEQIHFQAVVGEGGKRPPIQDGVNSGTA